MTTTGTNAAPILIRSWRTVDGLPQNSVQAIAQTAEGYLWVGTRGGLARFDGVRFTTYGLADGLKGVNIMNLLDDGAGGLWIGTYGGGLSHWRDGAISTLTTADGLAHNNATVLASAEPGEVWIGSAAGLQHWGPNGFTRLGQAEGFPGGEVLAMTADREQGLWVSMETNGLCFIKGGRCEQIEGPPGRPPLHGFALLVDASGDLWVSIGNGTVLRRHAGAWTTFNQSHGLPASFIYCLAQGAAGEIWAGSQQEGLYVFREGRFHAVTATGSELDPAVRSIRMSRDGLIWIGTRAGGLSRLTPRRLASYPIGEKGRRGQLHSVVEEPAGQFWVATYGGGIYRGSLDQLEPVKNVPALNDHPFLLSGLRMRDGTLYFADSALLLRQEPGTGELRAEKPVVDAIAMCEGAEGELWVGTIDGKLQRLVEGVPQPVTNGTFPAAISSLERDTNSALWIGTKGAGLFRWENGQVRRWSQAEGLPFDMIATLHRDAEGTLWIGTTGSGLAWLRDGRIHSVNTRHGLGDNFITQILEDDDGHLWLGCFRGIFRASKRELEDVAAGRAEAVHPLALDESDGMVVAECTGGYSPAGLHSQSGLLLFATVRGVVAVDPKLFGAVASPPPVLIEEVLRDGKSVERQASLGSDAQGSVEPSNARRSATHVLSLSPGPRELEIRYTAFNFSKPGQIRFRHRLEGLNTEWTEAGAQRLARFALLPPGRYTFQVSAANEDGHWSETGASLAFIVQPFFWQTTAFRLVAVLLLMASGGGLVWRWAHIRIRRAEARVRLARAEAEAQQHRNEVAHLTRVASLGELSSVLAHELNQPLTAILSNAQAAQRFLAQEKSDPAEIRDILQDIVADDQRASEVIRRMRTLLKKGEFQPQSLDVNEVIQDVLRLMNGDLTARAVSVVTEFTAGLPTVRGDRVQLQQVLINLVLNAGDAMTHTAARARQLTLRSGRGEGGVIQISVADTGSGLPIGAEEKIFEPYHTTKSEGLGLGLSLSRSILLAHGGRLWAENRTEGGATFHFTLPVAKSDQ